MSLAKIQKILIYNLFISTIVLFVYSLGYFTNFVDLQITNKDFYNTAQIVNRFIFNYSFYAIVAIGLLLILSTQTKEHYSLFDYILVLTISILYIFLNVEIIVVNSVLKAEYLKVDFIKIAKIIPDYKESTFIFTIGNIINIISIVISLLTISLIVIKYFKDRGIKREKCRKDAISA